MGRMRYIRHILCISAWSIAAPVVTAQTSSKVCSAALQVCPKTLEGSVIDVPEDATWLDPKLPFCNEQVQVQTGGSAPPPSIVFIIDNSGSMSKAGNRTPNDPNEARFTVVRDLLDTIYRVAPESEVGLVMFSRRLQFDHRDNPTYFKTAFPDDTTQHDGFVPLTKLNGKVGAVNGVDTLKAFLQYTGEGNLVYATTRPNTRTGMDPLNIRDGTDITLGFDAAKVAMRDSKADKANQYFIFLSDGEPSEVDDIREPRKQAFREGENTPTTFTFYFRRDRDTNPPASISEMTENIRTNGYSTRNPDSRAWAFNAQETQLMTLILSNVINPIFSNKAVTPASARLVSGTTTMDNSSMDGGHFIFPDPVALAPGQTSVTLTYNYTYTDSGKTKTHTSSYSLNIRRVPKGTAGAPPAGVTMVCKDPGDIVLYHEGKKITLVTADHEKLEVRLILPSGQTCTNCTVKVQPKPKVNRPALDEENVPVNPAGGQVYSGSFVREIADPPASGDGRLQHSATDSIVVTWVNPDNPLEVIRRAFPYSDVNTALKVNNHNAYSVTDDDTPLDQRRQWVLVGSSTVKITPEGGIADCCRLVPSLTSEDSVKYVGIKVTASRSFKVEISVYDNLGQYVNRIAFSVSQAEFANLPKEPTGTNRTMRVLWDSRTESGAFAGTGAYIFKTTVTLNKVPGLSEEQVVRTDFSRVGVVRGR